MLIEVYLCDAVNIPLPRGIKRPGRVADHSPPPPSSAEYKDVMSSTSIPPIRLYIVVLI